MAVGKERRSPKASAAAASPRPANGLSSFSIDASAQAGERQLAALSAASATRRAAAAVAFNKLDPETAAANHLNAALDGTEIRRLARARVAGVPSEYKSLGTEASPLTNTTLVKFRQYINKIPVYGSIAVVELGARNECLAINTTSGTPSGVPSVAKASPAEALEVARKASGHARGELGATPRLNYYFDPAGDKWRLVYIVEDVENKARGSAGSVRAPIYMDYVVDAASGELIASLPRTTTAAALHETVFDALRRKRRIRVEKQGRRRVLHDSDLNVTTYDFNFQDLRFASGLLPGDLYAQPPPPWPAEAVSAHANAADVAAFLRGVVKRNGIDNRGGAIVSTVNCCDSAEATGTTREWRNAYWNGKQMVYGQVAAAPGRSFHSIAAMLDIVAHELFHGVTDATARLEYQLEAGALNESYSDIFGVIVANYARKRSAWRWEIGEGFNGPGTYLRSLADPTRYDQPRHMRDFRSARPPYTERNDYGNVHDNSGIHNYAAYRIMSARSRSGYVFKPADLAAMFYIALTVHLSRTSTFSDSRRAVLAATRSLFRSDAAALAKKVRAVESAFSAAGIE